MQNWLNPDPHDPAGPYIVEKPGAWNRIPEDIVCEDLSQPDVSLSISINPISPELPELVEDYDWDPASGDHPLSARAMLRVVLDDSTKENAPLKSTRKFPLAFELMVAQLKPQGSLARIRRSRPVRIAQNQVNFARGPLLRGGKVHTDHNTLPRTGGECDVCAVGDLRSAVHGRASGRRQRFRTFRVVDDDLWRVLDC